MKFTMKVLGNTNEICYESTEGMNEMGNERAESIMKFIMNAPGNSNEKYNESTEDFNEICYESAEEIQ